MQIMGDQASINGRDRGNGFRDCIKKNYPKLKLLEIPTKAWSGEDAAAGLDAILNSTPDLKAIYMHAGGVFLAPTLQTLEAQGHCCKPAGEPGHIVIVSNDGIPQEYDAIRKGEADATVSQPADLYAKYGLMYLKEAIAGKTFKPGPTDHDSTIVEVAPGVLEDQLAAPLVTKDNVDDKSALGQPALAVPSPMAAGPSGRTPIVEAIGVSKRYGADGRAARRPHPGAARRVPRPGRAQRRRQVDAGRRS